MRNKSIQNTNVQTNTKVPKKDDRQTDRHMLRKFYSNVLGKRKKILQYITVRNHTLPILVSISANCKYIFNLELNCLTEQ